MPLTVLGLGSNVGNREENMADALSMLEENSAVSIERLSSLYETTPFDVISEQEDYLNCCVLVQTSLSPGELLETCHDIENALGRKRLEYHGARTMDVDILLYENASMDTEKLTIPHKGILLRAFVLVPLMELFPNRKALGLDFSEVHVDFEAVRLFK